jgi:hypothetical protein
MGSARALAGKRINRAKRETGLSIKQENAPIAKGVFSY